MIWKARFWLPVLMLGLPVLAFKISKSDFPKFAGQLSCGDSFEICSDASQGFLIHGLSGDPDMPDPSAAQLTVGGKLMVGFLEGKPFSWPRYSVDFPAARWKWIVLNEVSSGEQNRAFLTLWKNAGDSLEFIKVFPHMFPLSLGELHVHSKTNLPDGSLLLILKGEGSDAGVNLQDYHFVRLQQPDKMDEIGVRSNRSEIPVKDILDKLNNDQPVEEVQDSALACDVVAGRKAPSGGPWLRFTKSRTKVLYTKAGPQETPNGKDTALVDIWKAVKSGTFPR